MKKTISRRFTAELALFMGLIFAVFTSFARFDAACDDLRQNVLRLHIIANSNSEADQAVKLLVRDRILSETTDISRARRALPTQRKKPPKDWAI